MDPNEKIRGDLKNIYTKMKKERKIGKEKRKKKSRD